MKTKRKIKRIAFLQEYENRPEKLMELIPEVAAKGYHAAAFAARIGQERFIKELAQEAAKHGLEVMAFTGFMKYQQDWLKDHPDQNIRLNTDAESRDQDNLSVLWGCPFNPDFKQRYFGFLRKLGAIPNMSEVWVNDEAYLGFGPDKLACYCPVCARDWATEIGGKIPRPPFQNPAEKARWVNWRLQRWNAVHAEMKGVLCHDHAVRAVFLTSPACCVGSSPWITGVDLASMADSLDGIMTDPYYTFHGELAKYFRPREVYLSECCRILAGACGARRQAEICAQGFSHGTFSRPLDERDGWWAGVVPAAVGLDAITAYTYTLQRISPMQKTYEKAFKLDRYFNQAAPCHFIGVVNSLETQCLHMDGDGDRSWMVNRLLPVTEMLRHQALPYAYLPSGRMNAESLKRFPVIILPWVTCMSAAMRGALREYAANGGVLIACGETATRDATGELSQDNTWLEEVFGVRDLVVQDASDLLEVFEDQAVFNGLPWPDNAAREFKAGIHYPVVALDHAVQCKVCPGVEPLARFKAGGNESAVVMRQTGQGRAIFIGGLPGRVFHQKDAKLNVRNFIGHVLRNVIMRVAGDRLPLRVNNFDADIPMFHLRPMDQRLFPTAEFLPCVGGNLYLATVASYFRESMRFEIEARIPHGKTCVKVRELVSGEPVRDFKSVGNTVKINVSLTPDDCLKVFAFFLTKR